MKRFFSLLIALTAMAAAMSAQNPYRFYYIAQNYSSDKYAIAEELRDADEGAREGGWTCIYYLANTDNPMIVTSTDSEDKFEALIGELQYRYSNEINAQFDAENVLKVLEKTPFTDRYGNLLPDYEYIDFYFYVNSADWDNCAIDLIGPLAYAMNLDNNNYLQFQINRSSGDEFEYNEKRPFGSLYKGKLNDNFSFLTY